MKIEIIIDENGNHTLDYDYDGPIVVMTDAQISNLVAEFTEFVNRELSFTVPDCPAGY